MTVGICDFICALAIGIIGSGAVLADAQDPSLFIKNLSIQIMASSVGLLGLIVAFLMQAK